MPKIEKTEKSEYAIEAIVQLDNRGQILLPKDIRDKFKLSPGDKLALVALEKDEEVCCISLFKTEEFEGTVRKILKPLRNV